MRPQAGRLLLRFALPTQRRLRQPTLVRAVRPIRLGQRPARRVSSSRRLRASHQGVRVVNLTVVSLTVWQKNGRVAPERVRHGHLFTYCCVSNLAMVSATTASSTTGPISAATSATPPIPVSATPATVSAIPPAVSAPREAKCQQTGIRNPRSIRSSDTRMSTGSNRTTSIREKSTRTNSWDNSCNTCWDHM